jgi:hypothetical protein
VYTGEDAEDSYIQIDLKPQILSLCPCDTLVIQVKEQEQGLVYYELELESGIPVKGHDSFTRTTIFQSLSGRYYLKAILVANGTNQDTCLRSLLILDKENCK